MALARYAPGRQLKNRTAPLTSSQAAVVEQGDLPEDALTALEADYGPGRGYRPATGFNGAAEIVKVMRGEC